MIHRLREVAPSIYRGSAPSPQDVLWLKEKLGIKKIVSLDEETGQRISRSCKLLGIKHIMLPLDGTRASLIKFLKHNLKDLLVNDGPTFFHCRHGKDRTGLLAALFECKYLHKKPEAAISEAKKLGFGIGVDPKIVHLYEKLIKACKPIKDVNSADIVSNEREYRGDNRDSYLGEANPLSFAPYLNISKQFPYDASYDQINDQSPTRENYEAYKNPKSNQITDNDEVPLVGQYNNDAGITGTGPVFPAGGFISD